MWVRFGVRPGVILSVSTFSTVKEEPVMQVVEHKRHEVILSPTDRIDVSCQDETFCLKFWGQEGQPPVVVSGISQEAFVTLMTEMVQVHLQRARFEKRKTS